jgi:hypothetical protein
MAATGLVAAFGPSSYAGRPPPAAAASRHPGSHPYQQQPVLPSGYAIDPAVLKKLRLRIDTDDPLFPALKKLKIRGKDLNDLPPELFDIVELEVLDLSPEREACIDYHLTMLPPDIGNLVNLRVVMLDTNHLDDIPAEISLLTQLERLSISNNHIRRIPDGFSCLKRLESLHAANNRFDQFPEVLCELYSLRFLDFSDNLLTELPANIANLQRLECLLLVFNRLERLPDAVCRMTSLHLLWLGNNRLRRLPRQFGNLRNLDWGFRHTSSSVIDGNPITEPPVDVCKKGVDAIARYFNQQDDEHRRQTSPDNPHSRRRR